MRELLYAAGGIIGTAALYLMRAWKNRPKTVDTLAEGFAEELPHVVETVIEQHIKPLKAKKKTKRSKKA